ncbi:MarR family winged helix-turn-helix transcriptional regulator [Sphaerochaeta sp.]|uniref:MarR family winged helix-turn-helix transcriptional regulator n=1 Tax=Sphaerochaeta sp. TaxID=1972642 RepID=UPI002FC8A552
MIPSLGRLIAILYRKNQIYLNTQLKPYNLTSGEVGLLMSLYQEEGQTQEALSAALNIDKAATARTVKVLEQKGYVNREQDTEDKRCNRIHLTENARVLQHDIVSVIQNWSRNIATFLGEKSYAELYSNIKNIIDYTQQEYTEYHE